MVGYKRRDGPPSVDNHDIKAKEDSSLPEVKKINHEESSCGEFQIHHIHYGYELLKNDFT